MIKVIIYANGKSELEMTGDVRTCYQESSTALLKTCEFLSENRLRTAVISEMREIDFYFLHIMLEYDCRNCAYFTPCYMLGGCSCYILAQCLQALEY